MLLNGEIVGYERHIHATNSIVFFIYNGKPRRMPTLQAYEFFYPRKGAKVQIYYTDQYKDYVFLADRPQIVWRIMNLLFGLAFMLFGLLGLLGFIPTK